MLWVCVCLRMCVCGCVCMCKERKVKKHTERNTKIQKYKGKTREKTNVGMCTHLFIYSFYSCRTKSKIKK